MRIFDVDASPSFLLKFVDKFVPCPKNLLHHSLNNTALLCSDPDHNLSERTKMLYLCVRVCVYVYMYMCVCVCVCVCVYLSVCGEREREGACLAFVAERPLTVEDGRVQLP